MRVGMLCLFAMLACTATAGAQPKSQSAPAAPRIAIADSPANVDVPKILRQSGVPVPLAVRLAAGRTLDPGMLDERLTLYRALAVPVWLSVDLPASLEDVAGWRSALARVLAKHRDAISILELQADAQPPDLVAFAARLAATDVRATRESIQVALGDAGFDSPPRRRQLYTPELSAYLDLLSLPATADPKLAADELRAVDPGARVIVWGADAGGDASFAARRFIDTELESLGTDVLLRAWAASDALESALRTLTPLAPLLNGEIAPLDASAAGLSLADAGGDLTRSVRHRLLFDNRTFATYLVYWADPSVLPLETAITLPVEGVPAVYHLTDGARLTVTDYSRDGENGRVRARLPRPGGPVLVDFNEGASDIFVERSEASAARQLTVDEVIARHQQQQRAQDALVGSYVATARMEQHFRPTMTDPGYDVVTENRYFVADDGIEWEELSFSVNGSKWGSDRPPFPLLQPEKVLSLPLQLRFGTDYRYRLAGTERVGDYDCHVVRFEPVREGPSLYRGTVWIDRRTFARIRVQAVQSGLTAPVVSNEEIQTYAPAAVIDNRPVFLFAGLEARQIILIAGRNLLVEKKVAFRDFRVNDGAFESSRTEARRSDNVMYRETERGLRYYVKDGERRVVSERATRTARAMAMGVTLDPSYAFPLPILGLNYLNFEFRGRPDTQLAVLFAGVLAAGNLQRPKVGGTPFDASVDFFAIAVPSTDALHDAAGELEGERLLTWPLTSGANIGWQYTPFQKITAQYQFRFDGYAPDRTTDESFRRPASTVTNGLGAAWEYRRAGYSLALNGTWYARANWRQWGYEGALEESRPTYLKYGASLSRDWYFKAFHKVHVNAAWFGGERLDRFAKYQFGMFDDTRIHGVPSSGVRFGELGVARGSYSFNIFEQYRLDLFLERAWGRDRAFDDLWQPITGIGAAVNFRAPWNTILRTDFGKSFLPDRYKGVGSATLQVMVLKPLR